MTEEKKSALTFPCDFPVKVFGITTDEFEPAVVKMIRKYQPDLHPSAVTQRPSKDGKYLALTILVHANSQEQLDRIYHDLSSSPLVLMAL
jgi:putative lipoic acid-binding regulatory protein